LEGDPRQSLYELLDVPADGIVECHTAILTFAPIGRTGDALNREARRRSETAEHAERRERRRLLDGDSLSRPPSQDKTTQTPDGEP
jgi:hypothetical protein